LSLIAGAVLLFTAAGSAEPASQPAGAAASDLPQWRGPNRDGVALSSPKLLDSWPKEGPKVLWKSDAIPCNDDPKQAGSARAGGSGSPVVEGGRVFVYADCTDKYVVTSKMLDEWGWMDGVPDDLATKIEAARNKVGNRKGAEVDKQIDAFIATLDGAQVQKFGDHIRKRIKLGENTAGWWGMTTIVGAGARDKEFPTYTEFAQISYKGGTFGGLTHGHGDGGTGGNYIMMAVSRECKHTDTVFCLDASTGKNLWKQEFPGHGDDGFEAGMFPNCTGTSGTPAVYNDKCYVAGSAGLYCLSAKDGKVIWKAKTPYTHSSPLVANGMVYVLFGHRAETPGALSAFDAETGQLVWRQPKLWTIYSSISLWTGKDGKSALVCYAWGGASLVDPKTGDILNPLPNAGPSPWGEFNSPVISGDAVVVVCGSKLTGFKIDYPKAEKIWSLDTVMDNRGSSPVVYQGHVYIFGRGGCLCVDAKTGEKVWRGKALSGESASPVIADGKAFTHGGGQPMRMLKATPEGADAVLGEAPDLSCPYASPAISGGKMYLRGLNNVICYDLRAEGQ
jgi:outer membrane protein assembly factor BamB